jgi:beta-galactosidase
MQHLAYVLAALALFLAPGRLVAQDYVWIEGEKPTASNFKANLAGWGNKHFLSGEKWLQIAVDENNVEKAVPAEGVVLKYAFTLPKAGPYEVWNRIGYEFARSPFAWRIGGGTWHTVKPDELTTDLMELSFFTEVAWLKMGEQKLAAGPHTLEIKLPKAKNAQGKYDRILYGCDALCLHRGPFRPHSRYKPGEAWRTPADEQAGQHVFALPEPASPAARTSVALAGAWEITRHDEQLPGETAKPIASLPAHPNWSAIAVPGDKNTLRPDLLFAHRVWYRTRVRVPESQGGRSFHLVFPQNNLNTTVFVNGVYCGFDKNPFARVVIDVTKGVKPGVNEVWVGIKDAWYGYSTNPKDPMKLRRKFNLPLKFSGDGFQDLAYPVWGHFESGILVTPEFVAAGPACARDVFCKPSVARKELAVEVTLANPSANKVEGEVVCAAVNAKTGKVEKTLTGKPFTLAPGAEQVVNLKARWADAKLWWPDEPNLYRLRTTVRVGGKDVDVSEVTFGFREWTTQGKDFKLNGVVWHGWADTHSHATRGEWVRFYRKTNQKFMRFWGTSWMGLPPDAGLDFFDRNGVVVRRSGMLDGEAIGYMAVENDPDLKKESVVKMQLMRNWRDQVVAQVRGERNHPSVMLWSIENEWLYINCINLYGGLMDQFEAEVTKTAEAVRKVDPTRPTMTDGGGATKANTMPVHGDHYTTGKFTLYPALAYDANVKGGGRGRWEWDQKRPRFIGEELFAAGHNPAYSYFGGEEVFIGQQASRPTIGLVVRMLTEGYRWYGCGAFHFWQMQDAAEGQYDSNAPRAVFCRQWDWTFGSGQKVRRTFGVFNDTRSDDPVAFTWALNVAGKKVAGKTTEHKVPAGHDEKFDVTLTMPEVTGRQEGELVLTLAVKGAEVFRAVKKVSVLGETGKAQHPALAKLTGKELLVYDPQGGTAAFLKKHLLPFTRLSSLTKLPAGGKVLLVGKDALTPAQSASSALAAFAAAGRRVVVLEQKHPLKYQAFPAAMDPAQNEGRIAFIEDLTHPVFRGLAQKDFFTWAPGEVVYRDAYLKPTRGGKSLVQCDELLRNTALAEVPVGDGLMLLCQLVVGETLPDNAVARKLLLNLLDHAAGYQLTYRPVTAALGGDGQLTRALDAVGLRYTRAPGPLAAIARPGERIAVVRATPANLKEMADHLDQVNQFTAAGGWVVLNGLTPEGLASYNKLVGFDHMIRPFRRERVTFPARKSPLTAGLSTSDIVLYSSKQIFPWQAGNYVASDVYSYVVDYDEVAPFAQFPNDFLLNLVNGFVSADGWPLIVNVPAPNKPPLDWLLRFPKEQEFTALEWVGNTFYYPVTKVSLLFDGKNEVSFATKPTNDVQTFTLAPPRKGKDVTLRLADWLKVPGKGQTTGADNIRLWAKRPAWFYDKVKPMLNVGGMMEYPRGKGGIVLCNLLFKAKEEAPENAGKKRTILAALLRNLKAPFAEGKTIIAGARLNYEPVDLSKQANQYRTEKGWFGDRRFTFKDLPTGKQTFAGVPFTVYDFPTSPVPTVVMLGGPGVPNKLAEQVRGIPVNRKADALFFLQAARIDRRGNPDEVKKGQKFELFRYVVHYADGKKLDVPVYAETDVDDYRQKTPAAVPGAQVAWSQAYEGSDLSAVAYCKQWNNPRPEVQITSIDVAYGKGRRGVPAVLAVTTATARR